MSNPYVEAALHAAPSAPSFPAPATAASDDAATIDGLMRALYDTISGPAGAPRDWSRLFALYAPHARLVPVRATADGDVTVESLDVAAYVESRAPFFAAHAFHELELERTVTRYGALAHVWSTYEARATPDGPPLFRGANSLQLLRQGGRWWVLSVAWQPELPGSEAPRILTGPLPGD
jgi:hypothetical protein